MIPEDIRWAERSRNRNELRAACSKTTGLNPEQRDWLHWAVRSLGDQCYWPLIHYCIWMAFHPEDWK